MYTYVTSPFYWLRLKEQLREIEKIKFDLANKKNTWICIICIYVHLSRYVHLVLVYNNNQFVVSTHDIYVHVSK